MKSIQYAVPGLLSLFLLPASIQCFAQASTINECQAIQDRLARYACYDKWDSASGTVRQSAPAPRASTTTSRSEQPAQAAPQAPATTDTFGRQPASNARVVEGDRGTELFDTVADIEARGPSLVLVTLESGQQWVQMISKRYPLAVGDEVRIYPTRWGSSYRLSSERVGGYIQVERVDDGSAVAIASPAPAPRAVPAQEAGAVEDEDSPGLFGRTVGAIGGVGSRIGGIFGRDSAEDEAAAPAASAGSAAPVAEATVGEFGRASASNARVVDGDQGSELFDTVASLEQAGPSLWLITLQSGQQWKQMISKRYTLEVGDEVRIYPTRWGSSYRLSSERAGGYIQVERVD